MHRLSTALALVLALPATAEEFNFAVTTDPQTMDPHAVNSTPVLGFLNNVYEGLVRRGKDMSIEPSLAVSWEPIGEGEGWRFKLREGVTFQDGAAFNADDVVFSYERASSEQADTSSWFAPVSEVIKVDDYTVDIMTTAPNPIFPDSIANWMMMDSGWAEANGAERPDKEQGNFATLNANGTGPFQVVSRQPDLETVLEPHAGWWGEVEHNLTRVTMTPIQNPATALAALLSGDVDFINPVPIQDVARLEGNPEVRVIQGIEARVIMLGFDQQEGAAESGQGAADMFLDPRAREAVAKAINVPAILQTIMRGNAEVASQMVSPAMRGFSEANAAPYAYDAEAARSLAEEAGLAGQTIAFKCPNDRYLNDEAVCQAVTSMLAQAGMEVSLDAMPVSNYWPELRADNFDMYLLGWSPGTFDAEHPIRFLAATQDDEAKLGSWNFGGYSNARVDELLPMIQSEIDDTARQAMLDETAKILQDEVAYVPLYVQPLVWGARSGVELTQRPDDFFILRWVTVN
ncbi:ABC transporter substrate-binding protein [Vannielia litorea]|uniref:ABC transporter substrate-binding protein n=1 Tax=Vannielia litorea TaxID=1217970 RepID=UPI001C985CB5|nr:ABC transporter substrate-binding protein [Vannielia litorea]MBY6048737.1 ABC transporter substrate-binding protein [Vannielia litorea]MBY6076151.1 ABC transporter substrate-binding protein [Vannielia litorea]